MESALIRDLVEGAKGKGKGGGAGGGGGGYDGYVSVHSGERQFFSGYVDTASRTQQRRPPGMEADGDVRWVGDRILQRTSPYFRDWGVGWERNSYSADGTLFDWVAGVGLVKYTYCVELWGGLLETGGMDEADCFMQFNPPAWRLQGDLDRMREFFIQYMLAVVERERGVRFEPVEWEQRSQEERDSMEQLCAEERRVHRLHRAVGLG